MCSHIYSYQPGGQELQEVPGDHIQAPNTRVGCLQPPRLLDPLTPTKPPPTAALDTLQPSSSSMMPQHALPTQQQPGYPGSPPPHPLLDPLTPTTHQSTTNSCPGCPPRVTEALHASVILQPLSMSMAALPIHPQPRSTSQRLHTPHLALRRDGRGSASPPAVVFIDSAPAR